MSPDAGSKTGAKSAELGSADEADEAAEAAAEEEAAMPSKSLGCELDDDEDGRSAVAKREIATTARALEKSLRAPETPEKLLPPPMLLLLSLLSRSTIADVDFD